MLLNKNLLKVKRWLLLKPVLSKIRWLALKPILLKVKILIDKLDHLDSKIDRLERVMNSKLSETNRQIKNHERTNYQQLTQYMELRRVFDNDQVMPPLRGYAISPDLVFYLLSLLDRFKPRSILEFGSGFSSVVFSRYAHSEGAKVVSVDHEPYFSKKSEAYVNEWGYDDHFNLIIADVKEQEVNGTNVFFYDRSPVEKHSGFDFVFLDGPPQKLGLKVRGGLLPLFRPLLSPGCIIVLDDYYRPGEREFVDNWLKTGLVELIEKNESIEKHAVLLRVI